MQNIMKNPVDLLQETIEDERYLLSGYEKPSEALTFEAVRAIDFAFCRELIPELQGLDDSERQMENVRKHAINAALQRILPTELKAGVPTLFASNTRTAEQTDEFLLRMGYLTMAEKQLNLLRSGALKAEIDQRKLRGMKLLVLSINDATAYREQIGSQGLSWLSDMTVAEDRQKEEALERRHVEILPRLIKYLRSNTSPEELPFIGVDDYFREWAVLYLRRISFRDMLDDNDQFGGRPYSAYIAVLEALSAMSQQRLCYAGLLNADDPRIGIRNLMTGGALREDLVEGVASFLQATREDVSDILDHLTLSPGNAKDHLERGVPTLAPVVRTSQDLVVLPMYGLELNPFSFLWTELRRRYEKEWFEAANRRESRWVSQLRDQFPSPRWRCTDGVNIKRDGRVVTDIDFVAYDPECNSVMLFQLKWQQPFMNDDKLRRNNASSLVRDSNRWIVEVLDWIAAVGINGVEERLSIKSDGGLSIHLVVLGRYYAHFTAAEDHDTRAVWCDWGNFLRQRTHSSHASALEFVALLRESVEQATTQVEPESFFFPLGDIMVLVNPKRTNSTK
ncbi:hypothetical protein [Pseudomonas sp. GM60]|uniref:hypothetical protein n=1 Tax=Pseudomonas sp. GM60 TaxID=1144334 RepID=UPI000270D3F5|nr:hypothetical protein [Pseudomonas sp. GM60]EJM86840.1 hypothetical protein PMI32_00541 [Pseudomonas sp. GM60]